MQVKWDLGSITINKASEDGGITAELVQVLKDEDILLDRAMTRGCYGLTESLGSLPAHGRAVFSSCLM